ncbi:MAG: hypothetical protein AAGC97_03235 [Planctomycetota bacterium]
MIADQQPRLDQKLQEFLGPNEDVLVTAFGLRCFSKPTEDNLRVFGGAWLSLLMADRVYCVLTTDRLILMELTSRYLVYVEKTELAPSKIIVGEALSSPIYTRLDFAHLPEDQPADEYRIRFPRRHTSFEDNSARADRLIDLLRRSSMEHFPDAARAVMDLVHDSRREQGKKRSTRVLAWILGVGLSICSGLILMIISAMSTSLYVDDLDSATGMQLAVALLTTFLVAPLLAIAASTLIVRKWIAFRS